MSAPPSHIFVVRHGSRLDAADQKWHLTSPTPYDPPLTYGGFLQARQVGSQIWSLLEQAKLEYEASREAAGHPKKRKRFKVVIHSSPFLRCVQTSIGISAGLSQSAPDSIYSATDVVAPAATASDKPNRFPSTILRLDSFLGEWLSPGYFEMITPPPGSALMMGGAKAELMRRGNYTSYTSYATNASPKPTARSALWNAAAGTTSPPRSPERNQDEQTTENSEVQTQTQSETQTRARGKKGYVPLKPHYAVSSAGKIPEGIVEHARDACTIIDYQWDSMRPPLDFGDGGAFGEEWTAMHKRFRKGMKQLVNWYCTEAAPTELVVTPITPSKTRDDVEYGNPDEEEIENVVIIVSHGAGCNALMGAITHQPVLMDVGIASITMALRKENVDYAQLAEAHRDEATNKSLVPVDLLYEMRISATTEHLRSNASTPVSARSTPTANVWNGGSRGRTATIGSLGGTVMSTFSFSDSVPGSRSTSASAIVPLRRRDSGRASRNSPPTVGGSNGNTTSTWVSPSATSGAPSPGLWSPKPSTLRFMDDGMDETDDLDDVLPDFSQNRFKLAAERRSSYIASPASGTFSSGLSTPTGLSNGLTTPTFDKNLMAPRLSAPIKLQTSFGSPRPMEEASVTDLGDNLGGLWSLPRPPDDAERYRDLSQSKRRWTVNERA
ncbi:hypothetical protein B0I35DRAFT_7880 [Stachybotrys elegans]|uniref:Phosphoglycerate mutase n=1 Tax=Stachybotrys elegans TaxID=80388 RepID=A0A8K0T2A7_9HYPO|nr:hypothetical protein B0I35DRAFT_7880 [Stachybotrys elegans]